MSWGVVTDAEDLGERQKRWQWGPGRKGRAVAAVDGAERAEGRRPGEGLI